jgi:hypothetical protein
LLIPPTILNPRRYITVSTAWLSTAHLAPGTLITPLAYRADKIYTPLGQIVNKALLRREPPSLPLFLYGLFASAKAGV